MATAAPLGCDLRGMDACLYYNVGDDDTQVWVEHIGITGDLTCSETEDEDELTTRNRNRSVKEYTEGETDINITGTQVMDPEYQGWQALYSARTHGEPLDVMFLTQPISEIGAVGWRGKMRNKDRTFNAPATGSQTQNFSLRPAACTPVPVRPVKILVAEALTNYDPTIIGSTPAPPSTAAPTTTTT
jgi:hypothetical protein